MGGIMRLKNKKTGKVIDINLSVDMLDEDYITLYGSLEEFNEDWEDYEEPKEYWYLENDGDIDKETYDGDSYEERMIEIGNYFETKEEAERAVKKLKAWKRLKDIGCDFDGWNIKTAGSEGDHLLIHLHIRDCTECEKDLDLLFGGEK